MLRLFLFFPLFLLSQETYLLPDESNHLLFTLNTQIKNAQKSLYIFTPQLNEYELKKSIKILARKNVPVTIITTHPLHSSNQASQLNLFKNISVYTLSALGNQDEKENAIKGSYICIDEAIEFTLADDLSRQTLRSNYSLASYKKHPCQRVFKSLLQRAKPY